MTTNNLYAPPPPDQTFSAQALREAEIVRGEAEKAGEVLHSVGDGAFPPLEWISLR